MEAALAVLVVVLAAKGHAARHNVGVLHNLEDRRQLLEQLQRRFHGECKYVLCTQIDASMLTFTPVTSHHNGVIFCKWLRKRKFRELYLTNNNDFTTGTSPARVFMMITLI